MAASLEHVTPEEEALMLKYFRVYIGPEKNLMIGLNKEVNVDSEDQRRLVAFIDKYFDR